jgi:hypothetical protein
MRTPKASSHKIVSLPQARAPLFLDSTFTPFVTASLEEIYHAQRLRERIKKRYLNWPTRAVSFWSVGAD